MNILLNNRDDFFEEPELSIGEIIKRKNFTFKLLVTRLNGKLVKKEFRNETFVSDGDHLEIIHLISGG